MTLTLLLTIVLLALVAQAWFVAAEVAFAACDRAALSLRAAQGGGVVRMADRLASKPQVTTSLTLLGANATSIVAVIATAWYIGVRGVHPLWAVAMVVPPFLLFGQVLPRTLSPAAADTVVTASALPLTLLSWLGAPVLWLVAGWARLLARLAGTDRRKTFVSRDELAMLIESEPESDKPDIAADEREMIANVFELSEYNVRDLMVPLSEVTALPGDADLAEAAREIADKQHSRMPVYEDRVDNVVGIVHVFDVLAVVADHRPEHRGKLVRELAHAPIYVPETMKATELAAELQAEGAHLAVVVDEYGGAVGIVTVEDLLETIVGAIDDEFDDEPSPIKPEKPGVWWVEAKTSVTRLNQELDVSLPESDDYETIAGLLIDRFRRIPEVGESLPLGGVVVEVVAANDRAITAVRVTKKRK